MIIRSQPSNDKYRKGWERIFTRKQDFTRDCTRKPLVRGTQAKVVRLQQAEQVRP